MRINKIGIIRPILTVLVMIFLTGCQSIASNLIFSPTPSPSMTPIPPTITPILPTFTPLPPTPTFTEIYTATPLESPTPSLTPPPPKPSATLSEKESILVYYINKNVKGQYGCGEALYWLNTGSPLTGNSKEDVRYAAYRLTAYRGQSIGELYNAYHLTNFSVSHVEVLPDGTAIVFLQGTHTPSGDYCDVRRIIDQMKMTIKHIPGVNRVKIRLNGVPFEDALQKK